MKNILEASVTRVTGGYRVQLRANEFPGECMNVDDTRYGILTAGLAKVELLKMMAKLDFHQWDFPTNVDKERMNRKCQMAQIS